MVRERALPDSLIVQRVTLWVSAHDSIAPYGNFISGSSGLTVKSNKVMMFLLSSGVRFCFLIARGGGSTVGSGAGGGSMMTSCT